MESKYVFIQIYNVALEAFVLNFGGRVVKPSVKNFQLIDKAQEGIVLNATMINRWTCIDTIWKS